jgi:hypothetical protein
MRKFTFFILIFISIILSTTPCYARKHNTRTHVRYASGTIYKYDVNKRLYYIKTDDGNVWGIRFNCPLSNNVTVKFDTMGTKKVTDDRILKVF